MDDIIENLDIIGVLLPGIDIDALPVHVVHVVVVDFPVAASEFHIYTLSATGARSSVMNMIVFDLEGIGSCHGNALLTTVIACEFDFIAVDDNVVVSSPEFGRYDA